MPIVQSLNNALAGRYRIDREVGRGGMATVYLAQDVRHERPVALKVLNPELGAVLGATRFLAEIRVTANLQHPNLLPLFDSGEADGLLFYVMPYVDGESLRIKLTNVKQLPIDEAVHIAAAVAGALEYAHAHGVIHRDLKPENILLQMGEPVVADFGLALAVSNAGGGRITQSGISLGTPQYMSPEQAAGERLVDGRSDVYSLSAVLYEMLTGDPPHTGNSIQAIIAKVITDQPPSVRLTRPTVPEHLDRAIARGLEKLPADRWSSAREFAAAITGARQVASSDVPSLAFRRIPRSQPRWGIPARVPWVAFGLAVGVASGMMVATARERHPAPRAWFELAFRDSSAPVPEGGLPWGNSIALSRDGSLIAYPGGPQRALFVRSLRELTARRLEATEHADCPSFSPDGHWIVFTSRGVLKKVAARGGSPIVLADTGAFCGVWTESGEIVFNSRRELLRIPAEGGRISRLAPSDTSEHYGNLMPSQMLPGGRGMLIHLSDVGSNSNWQLGHLDLASGRVTKLAARNGTVRYAARYSRGHLLFAERQSVVAVPFDLRTLGTSGPEVVILQDSILTFSTSDNGSIAYISGNATFSLVAVDERGVARTVAGNPAARRPSASGLIPLDTAYIGWPRLSPDAKRVALEMKTGPYSWDVWVYDLASRTAMPLTRNFSGMRPAGWTDRRTVVFQSAGGAGFAGPRRIVSQPWDGSASPREFVRLEMQPFDMSLGPPRGYAAFGYDNDVWIVPLDTPRAARPLVATQAAESQPRISRDGRLVAYTSDESGMQEVFVHSVVGPTRRIQVSSGGGVEPMWGPAGGQLYYRSPEYVMRATLTTNPELTVARRDTLFRDVFERESVTNYDVFPNGRELLMVRKNSGTLSAAVLLDWTQLLERRAAVPN
jgi:serine/threonine-protein kinase